MQLSLAVVGYASGVDSSPTNDAVLRVPRRFRLVP